MKWSYTKVELYEKWNTVRLALEEPIRIHEEREYADDSVLMSLVERRKTLVEMLADIFELKVDPVTMWRDTTFEGSRDLFTKAGLYAKWKDVRDAWDVKAEALFDELNAVDLGDSERIDAIESERELCYVRMNVIGEVLSTIGLLYDGY